MQPSIQFVGTTGSTNADLLERLAAAERVGEGHWLVADHQESGRGRHGRRWLDAPGNFMGSTVVTLHPGDPPAPSLSFVAALAAYEAILPRLADPRRLRLKWPNDIELDRDKVCGILLEREGAHAVIGIGVNLAAAPQLPDRRVASLAEQGPAPQRDAFARALAASFDQELERWRSYGTEPILARWQAIAHPPGTPMTVHDAGGVPLTGTFDGLEPDGALRLRLTTGTLRTIHAGDIEAGAH